MNVTNLPSNAANNEWQSSEWEIFLQFASKKLQDLLSDDFEGFVDDYIKDIGQSNLSPAHKAVLKMDARKHLKELRKNTKILNEAYAHIQEPEKIKFSNEDLPIRLNEKNSENKIVNLDKLYEYSKLEYNWNDNKAEPFDEKVIDVAWKKIKSIENQPKVFPTACGSIQFEYQKDNGDYLEFEIYGDRIEVFKITGGKDEEFNISITEDLNNIINEFMKIS